ncbi:hypothetical protein GCM10007304_33860 [Rhodococcoides trifolii]|uniref:DUF308 domain-containing protein n=1 Tax=Rhodococcoides trifolii TaxID=908250 RepID=A0A917LF28_9NOCA|nr:hypothetical protein [Rhodococcus trifolii]GGG16922.1 hypothetical protein GCM10007304_33860 [Rhodococcus trifolii]
MTDIQYSKENATVLGLSRTDRVAVVVGFALLAAAVGAAVPFVGHWVLTLQWTPPFYGPLELIDSWTRWVAVSVLAGVGLLAGGAFGVYALLEQVVVTMSDSMIRFEDDNRETSVPHEEVSAIFLDGKQLVVLGQDSTQVIRTAVEAKTDEIRDGARRHHYPWFDSDPHAELFRRWAPGTPDLPPAANALLKVRADALEKKSRADIEEFRVEVEKLGFVVREVKKAQYWRPLVRS